MEVGAETEMDCCALHRESLKTNRQGQRQQVRVATGSMTGEIWVPPLLKHGVSAHLSFEGCEGNGRIRTRADSLSWRKEAIVVPGQVLLLEVREVQDVVGTLLSSYGGKTGSRQAQAEDDRRWTGRIWMVACHR